ncbi:MAG: SDR family oxidoreductase [Colwellia sp.]|nr:SDR family oxidoreductase [Colwellia sp.]
MSFENQVAIVIGASSNIGKQVATELLKQGALMEDHLVLV